MNVHLKSGLLVLGSDFNLGVKFIAMKHKLPFKFVIAGIVALSLFSVIYVNVSGQQNTFATAPESKQSVEVASVDENEQQRNIPIPDVTVLGRIVDLAQRLVSHTP